MREMQQKKKLIYIKHWSSERERTCLRNVGQDCLRNSVGTYGFMACTMPQRPSFGVANEGLRKDRFIFQKDNSEDWEPCPQYKAALGECPELVRVENCLCWTPMVDVLPMLPRVVHPVDVQRNEICVNGRDWHYLCGVIATENVFPGNGKKRPPSVKEGFHLKLLDRKLCLMYPEEKLGGFINSATAQWQVVDALFQGMREI